MAYELSPYEETILIDSDYLILDDSLLKLFATNFDYRLMHYNRTPSGPSLEMMGNTSLPFVWATIVLFRKTLRAKLFFSLVGRIQRNYNYYRMLYIYVKVIIETIMHLLLLTALSPDII